MEDIDAVNPEIKDAELTEEELVDAVGELPEENKKEQEEDQLTSVSQLKPTAS